MMPRPMRAAAIAPVVCCPRCGQASRAVPLTFSRPGRFLRAPRPGRFLRASRIRARSRTPARPSGSGRGFASGLFLAGRAWVRGGGGQAFGSRRALLVFGTTRDKTDNIILIIGCASFAHEPRPCTPARIPILLLIRAGVQFWARTIIGIMLPAAPLPVCPPRSRCSPFFGERRFRVAAWPLLPCRGDRFFRGGGGVLGLPLARFWRSAGFSRRGRFFRFAGLRFLRVRPSRRPPRRPQHSAADAAVFRMAARKEGEGGTHGGLRGLPPAPRARHPRCPRPDGARGEGGSNQRAD